MTRLTSVFCLALAFVSGPAFAAGLSGNYIAEFTTGATAEKQYARVSVKVDGTGVSGVWGDRAISGSLTGTRLEISLSDASGPAGTLTGS
ncbi:MAG: hypothetical protein ABI983_07465, partial [Acidobacteriota bacterium]